MDPPDPDPQHSNLTLSIKCTTNPVHFEILVRGQNLSPLCTQFYISRTYILYIARQFKLKPCAKICRICTLRLYIVRDFCVKKL